VLEAAVHGIGVALQHNLAWTVRCVAGFLFESQLGLLNVRYGDRVGNESVGDQLESLEILASLNIAL
jgi:hypothetical protein